MKNLTKQAVVLENLSSPYIHQAILILKEYDPTLESKVIEEAEKIVANYLNNPSCYTKKRVSKTAPVFLTAAVLAALSLVLLIILH